MYCFEASNIVNDALHSEGINSRVAFTYLPVNHINASTGAIQCESGGESLDCEGTTFDQCLVDTYCKPSETCSAAIQLQVSDYLACIEGPYANEEVVPDSSLRQPCMAEAGLDYDLVTACTEDAERVSQLQAQMNTSKAEMMASLGDTPGYFPHIFVDGVHQYNATTNVREWPSLTRTLCDIFVDGDAAAPEACEPAWLGVSFNLTGAANSEEALASAVATAINFIAGNVTFPEGTFFTDDDDLAPPGAPSYLDVRAVLESHASTSATGGVEGDLAVLSTFAGAAREGCATAEFRDLLNWALSVEGVTGSVKGGVACR